MAWHSRPSACVGCSAHAVAKSFVPSRGPKDAPLLLLGQGPGEVEASLGSPFMGPSGQTLGTWLRLAGIDQQRECRISNVAWCWLPDNREPSRSEMEHCKSAHWGVELPRRRVIVPIGVPAMRQFYAKAGESTAGQIIKWQGGSVEGHASPSQPRSGEGAGVWATQPELVPAASVEPGPPSTYVVGLLHPAFILRGNWGLEPLQIQTLKLVRRILDGEEPLIYDFTKPPPGANLYPTMEDLRAWRAGIAPGDKVVVDIEAAGKVHVLHGLIRVKDLQHVSLWWRQPGGDPWPHESWSDVVEWAYEFYANPNILKCFHNGAYDVEQLEEVGFEVNGYGFDTLLAAHVAFPEMRKRLESVSRLCGGPSGWKALLKEGEGHQK